MKNKKNKNSKESEKKDSEKEGVDKSPQAKLPDSQKSGSLQELIEKNIKWSQVIYEQNRKIKRRLNWMVFGSYFRLAIIVVPIILAIIYLPSYLREWLDQYSQLFLGGSTDGISGITNILSNFSSDQIKEATELLQN